MELGLVHLYIGSGKGKTTAAIGLCTRAIGSNLRVGIAQFLKNGRSGEMRILQSFDTVTVFPTIPNVKFTFAMSEEEKNQAASFYRQLLATIREKADALDVLLLDEVIDAVNAGLLDVDDLLSLIKTRKQGLEVILTGRNPPPEILDIADYISDIQAVRHPYDKGLKARRGIEM